MKNAISWFEIPATDIDRAQKFYEAVFQVQMIPMDFPRQGGRGGRIRGSSQN